MKNSSKLISFPLLLFITSYTNSFSQHIVLETQEEVDSFDQNIFEINGNLTIGKFNGSVSNINNIANLSNLVSVSENVYIINNDSLTNLNGLDNLSLIGSNLRIDNNDRLDNIDHLNKLNSVGGNLSISFNRQLLSISGLSNLNLIGGDLSIIKNETLPSLQGLEELNSVQELFIIDNAELISLEGFKNLKLINGLLSIQFNKKLNDLRGLRTITSTSISLRIINNETLKNCCGAKHILESDSILSVIISDNALGCNSEEEVINAECSTVGINQYLSFNKRIKIFPNPTKNILSITSLDEANLESVYIYDLAGKLIFQEDFNIQETELDLTFLQNGFYLYKITSSNITSTGKLTKI